MWRYRRPVSKFLLSYAFSMPTLNGKKQYTDNNWKMNRTVYYKGHYQYKTMNRKVQSGFPTTLNMWTCKIYLIICFVLWHYAYENEKIMYFLVSLHVLLQNKCVSDVQILTKMGFFIWYVHKKIV